MSIKTLLQSIISSIGLITKIGDQSDLAYDWSSTVDDQSINQYFSHFEIIVDLMITSLATLWNNWWSHDHNFFISILIKIIRENCERYWAWVLGFLRAAGARKFLTFFGPLMISWSYILLKYVIWWSIRWSEFFPILSSWSIRWSEFSSILSLWSIRWSEFLKFRVDDRSFGKSDWSSTRLDQSKFSIDRLQRSLTRSDSREWSITRVW